MTELTKKQIKVLDKKYEIWQLFHSDDLNLEGIRTQDDNLFIEYAPINDSGLPHIEVVVKPD